MEKRWLSSNLELCREAFDGAIVGRCAQEELALEVQRQCTDGLSTLRIGGVVALSRRGIQSELVAHLVLPLNLDRRRGF